MPRTVTRSMPPDPLRRNRDLRARPGLGVSIPVPWDALPVLHGRDPWTLTAARRHRQPLPAPSYIRRACGTTPRAAPLATLAAIPRSLP